MVLLAAHFETHEARERKDPRRRVRQRPHSVATARQRCNGLALYGLVAATRHHPSKTISQHGAIHGHTHKHTHTHTHKRAFSLRWNTIRLQL